MLGSDTFETAGIISPKNGETDVALDEVLQWQAGLYAGSHNLYFGTVFEDVNDADLTDDRGVLMEQDIALEDTTYAFADEFVLDQTYYWRVDEVNATPDNFIYQGATWSFTAEPTYLNVTPIEATASTQESDNTGPENTINGSGLSDAGGHSREATDMWTSAIGDPNVWIEYEFDVAYQFSQMLVWNHNESYEKVLGVGIKDAIVEVSMDGETWTTLAEVEFAQATALADYMSNTTVDMADTVAQFVRIRGLDQWIGLVDKMGLSEVQFLAVPIAARRPTPDSGDTVDSLFDELVWRMGRGTEQNLVYASTDANLVEAADDSVLVGTTTERRLSIADAGLLYAEKYYWRVDEVSGDTVVAGPVWDFNSPDHYVIDDMESYDADNLIYDTWADGYDENKNKRDDNGSTIGDTSPYVEDEIFFNGSQSMPMYYDNTHDEEAAWVTLTVDDSDIFTTGGVEQLSLMFMGERGNTGGEFYVEINGKQVTSDASITSGLWTRMVVDLREFGNLSNASTLTLGVAGEGKDGVVYIDDVCLCREAPTDATAEAVEPGTDGLELYFDMEGDVEDCTDNNRDGEGNSDLYFDESLIEGAMDLGESLKFNGTDQFIDINDPIKALMPSLADVTITAWVSIETDSDSSYQRVFDFGMDDETYMYFSPRAGMASGPEFGILSPDSDSGAEQDVASSDVLTDGWHHLAVTIDADGADPNGLLTLYVDGVAVDTDETDTLPQDLGATTNNWLGRSQFEDDGYYDGLMDEFRIYSRTLSEGEIRWLAGDQ